MSNPNGYYYDAPRDITEELRKEAGMMQKLDEPEWADLCLRAATLIEELRGSK